MTHEEREYLISLLVQIDTGEGRRIENLASGIGVREHGVDVGRVHIERPEDIDPVVSKGPKTPVEFRSLLVVGIDKRQSTSIKENYVRVQDEEFFFVEE